MRRLLKTLRAWRYWLRTHGPWARRLTLHAFCLRITGQPRERWRYVVRRDPCSYCGATSEITVDHVWPTRIRGRREHALDVGAACRTCNHDRGNESLLAFVLRRHRRQPKALSRTKVRAAKRIEDRRRRTRVRALRAAVPMLTATIGDRIKFTKGSSGS